MLKTNVYENLVLLTREGKLKACLTVGVLHGLPLLGRFGDDFDHPALERTHFLSVTQKQPQQQAEVFPLVLVGDEQGFGTSEHLRRDEEQEASGNCFTVNEWR